MAIDKSVLLNGAKGRILFERQFEGDNVTPMEQGGSDLVQYFASAAADDGNAITLHAVSNVTTLPTYETIELAVPNYERGDAIEQDGAKWSIDPGSARIRTGAWSDGSLWLAHAVADPVDEGDSVVRWYEIETNAFPGGLPTLIQSGDVDPGVDVSAFSPAMAINADGQIGLAYLAAGDDLYVSCYFTGRDVSDPMGQMQPAVLLAEGQDIYDPGRGTIAVDGVPHYLLNNQQSLVVAPVDGATFWMVGEYATSQNVWGAQIGAFQVGTPGGEDWYAVEVAVGETISLTFSEPIRPGSVQAGDLQVGGRSASSVTLESANVLVFQFDTSGMGAGTYSVELSAGAVTGISGLGNRPYQASIEIDARAPRVAEVRVNGEVMSATGMYAEGDIEVAIRFDEDMFLFAGATTGPLGLEAEGIELVGKIGGQTLSPTSVDYDTDERVLTLKFDALSEDAYTLTLASNGQTFKDFLGNHLDGDANNVAGGDYLLDFTIDVEDGVGLPLSHQVPFGSLILVGEKPAAVVSDGNDRDEYSFYVQAGQTIAVAAQPIDVNASVTVELVGLGVTATSPAAGKVAHLSTLSSHFRRCRYATSFGQQGDPSSTRREHQCSDRDAGFDRHPAHVD